VACEESRELLHAYFDGELDAARAAEFERHLEGCSACVRALESQEALRSSLHGTQLYETTPPDLNAKIRSKLRDSAGQPSRRVFAWQLLAAAAALILAVGISWKIVPRFRSENPSSLVESALAAEMVDAHIRSLQPGHLTDVVSTDQHTVKPWFDGRIPFAPPVRDLAEEGFPLVGGRLDVLQGQTVAALVYGRRKHFINVFVWPERAGEAEQYTGTKNGYQWISWRQGELRLCAVSDTNRDDLVALKDLFSR
jgi:mycothiol system anti-sigma-R factor